MARAPAIAPPHDVAMLCLLALRDEEARAFLLAQDWRDVLGNISGADLLIKILEADVHPVCIEREGRVIRQFILNPDGTVAEQVIA